MMKSRRAVILLAVILAAGLAASGACRKKSPVENRTSAAGEAEAPRGWLEIKGADFNGHEVRDAATGAKVATLYSLQPTIPLPPGTYDVGFGTTFLKGVIIKKDETTVLEPGGLTVNHASLSGHEVVAVATGLVQGKVSAVGAHIVLLPGTYAVKFGPLSWTVEVVAGQTTLLEPGIIKVAGADIRGHRIYDAAGTFVGDVSATGNSMPLPPGDYSIELDGRAVSFTLEAGKTVTFER